MGNSTLYGACPPPFYDASLFPDSGGLVTGRFCLPAGELGGLASCCLPCPSTQWLYSDQSFDALNAAAQWISVASAALLGFVLLSYMFLPAQATRRHYLNTCLMISVITMNIGFIITLKSEPEQCYNEITPHDMYSSAACAWSGAFVICGGVCAVFWVLVRALSMHLQICWNIAPGRRFFYLSQLCGWVVPGAIFVAAITASGVSFRFGSSACHINHSHSLADYWIWMLVSSGATVIFQLTTVGYCAHVYLRNIWASGDAPSTHGSDGRASANPSSFNTAGTRAVWKRIRRVLFIQWRGLFLVSFCLTCVVFFSVVFVYLDNNTAITAGNENKIRPFVVCLIESKGKADDCYGYGQAWLVNEVTIGAVLIMLTFIGILVFPLVFRFSFITGWRDLLTGFFRHKQEFVSLDAINPTMTQWNSNEQGNNHQQSLYAKGPRGSTFEMQTPPRRYQKEYSIAEDAVTVTTASESWSPESNADKWGPRSPEMVYQSPYNGRDASLEEGHYHHTIGQAVAPPHPSVQRAKSTRSIMSIDSMRQARSPRAGYAAPYTSDWNTTGYYATAEGSYTRPSRPFPPNSERWQWSMGNAFAQQRRS
ncbi:hypothetical protein MBLNU457_3189t1 [Dothideomycetes sp. NU457]